MDDKKIWEEILKIQLDGVMMHIALFENAIEHELCGIGYMHKHQAEEEFSKYLHVLCDFKQHYGDAETTNKIVAPLVEIDGTTVKEKMMSSLNAYEIWEKSVYEQLESFYEELEEKEHIKYLICDVKEELKHIHLMENDLLDGKWEELNEWMIEKWGDN